MSFRTLIITAIISVVMGMALTGVIIHIFSGHLYVENQRAVEPYYRVNDQSKTQDEALEEERFYRSLVYVAPQEVSTLISDEYGRARICSLNSWVPKLDNKICALELRTGKVLWTYKPEKLNAAHYEIYEQGLVAYTCAVHSVPKVESEIIFLNPENGTLLQPFKKDESARLAHSLIKKEGAYSKRQLKIVLDNGWVLKDSPKYTRKLEFGDPKTKEIVRTIYTNDRIYTPSVTPWKNYIFYPQNLLDNDSLLIAQNVGTGQGYGWTVDLNQIVKDRPYPLRYMLLEVIGDIIYVAAGEHLFAFEPLSGKLLWHRNLERDFKLSFYSEPSSGLALLSAFSNSGDILIFEIRGRVVALDLTTMQYLWYLEPDTSHVSSHPMVHNGKVFLTCGKTQQLFKLSEEQEVKNLKHSTEP